MADLTYHPVLANAADIVRDARPARLLVVGSLVPDAIEFAGEARRADAEVALPTGCYSFVTDDTASVLVVTDGASPGAPTKADWSASSDDPLVNAHGWFSAWWDAASPIARATFAVGDDAVTVPGGQEARIRTRAFDVGAWWYQIRVDGRTTTVRETSLQQPILDDDPLGWIMREPASAARFAATLTRAKLREHLTDTVYSFRATRTLFRPYQFRPVMRLLSSGSLRLLIADEVGLGKTIEAGLVWTELDARNQANRVLVVCPSMLVPKWRAEMDERFGYDLLELGKPQLEEFAARVEDDRLPARFHAICGLERLRIWSGLERLTDLGPRFDLIVVDEAHAFRNSGTKSNALGGLLSDWADALVFLSATPLNLGNEDLYNLLELLAPGEFDDRYALEQRLAPNAVLNRIASSFFDRDVDNEQRMLMLMGIETLTFGPTIVARPEFVALREILGRPVSIPADIAEAKRLIARLHALSAVVTRTRKVEIQEHKAIREVVPISVQWTSAEAEFYGAFERWQRDRARKLRLPVGFVTQMPLRLASTCLPAARDRVLAWSPGVWVDDELDTDENDDTENAGDEAERVDLGLPPEELVDLARGLGDVDSKFDAFVEALLPIVEAGKRVLVFTFSRPTLAYLSSRLFGSVRFEVLHGGIAKETRHEVMRRFREGEFDVLLASRVASEGLDLEFCSAVVNYDLPWNPMEVEQRIGRIDRFGQTEDKILVLNFHTPGTIETDIIERVHMRIGVFSDSIGELEPILQSRLTDLRRTMFNFDLTEDQRARRLDEMLTALEEQRLTLDEVENASAYLSSTDSAEIEGLERDLVTNGRYVGQPELLELVSDWVKSNPGGSVRLSADRRRVTIRGTSQMENDLRGLQRAGERSGGEIEALARALRDEREISLCLDQELARVTGASLLSATHPLARAALRVPGNKQARFARLRLLSTECEPGEYFVLVAIARWTGIRASTEFWTAAVSLDPDGGDPESAGPALLAGLAQAQLRDSPSEDADDLTYALAFVRQTLLRKQAAEEARRRSENELLIETRRLSLRETHSRKVGQIQRRIATLRRENKTEVVYLQEAQLRNQERLLSDAEVALEAMAHGAMDVESLAACVVRVEAK